MSELEKAPVPVVIALTTAGWHSVDGGKWASPAGEVLPWHEAIIKVAQVKAHRIKKATETTEFWMTLAGTAGSATAMVAAMSDAGQALGQPWAGVVVAIAQVCTGALPVVYSIIRARAKQLEAQGK